MAVRQEKEKWKAEEGKLHVKRLEMDQAKVCRFPWHFHSFGADGLIYQTQLNSILYLLDQTVPLKCFINTKVCFELWYFDDSSFML
jgi:hypothetical protein